ncbi:MAG: peptidase [Gemmatimonadales bacterium]|nr:MAG: peptidase [Gemmatimonadales bacterium]
MGSNKRGTSYRSFGYLEPGRDYRAFALAPELDRVPEELVPLDAEQEKRARRLLESCVMISLHEHLGVFPANIAESPEYTREGRMATAFQGLAAAHWDAVFDNLMDGILNIESKSGWKWTEVLHDLGMRLCDLAHQDFVIPATKVEDILEAHRTGKVAWIASLEGAAMIENELDRIEILYGFGVRAMGITYSESNALGSGLKEPRDGGLTRFGRRAVERMNQVGMLIDCAHCGDQTTLDVIEASKKPIVLSHIGARALWNSNRLAPDEVLKACAGKGGVIGIEAAPHTTITRNRTTHTLDSVMEHFEYVADLVGIDHVAFGPDTIYGDHVGLHQVYAGALSLKEAQAAAGAEGPPNPPFQKVPYVRGLENPTEGSKNIVRWLVKRGYSDADIAKVMGENILRVLREVWV